MPLANTHSMWERGALVFFNKMRHRWLDAFGENVLKYIDHFTHIPVDDTTTDPTAWTLTPVEAGAGVSTLIQQTDGPGIFRLNAAANENDGAQIQMKGEHYLLDVDHPCYFGARFSVSEATESDALIGLCITDTSLLGGMTDGAFFRTVDAATALTFVTELNSAEEETTVLATIVVDTFYVLEFFWDGISKIFAYLDGALVATHATTLPVDEYLTPSVAYLNGAGAMANHGVEIDWIRAISITA